MRGGKKNRHVPDLLQVSIFIRRTAQHAHVEYMYTHAYTQHMYTQHMYIHTAHPYFTRVISYVKPELLAQANHCSIILVTGQVGGA